MSPAEFSAVWREWQADAGTAGADIRIAPGDFFIVRGTVANAGSSPWPTAEPAVPGSSSTGARVFHCVPGLPPARIAEYRSPLPQPGVVPGATARFHFVIDGTDLATGEYLLAIDLVREFAFWFADQGGQPLVIRFTVSGEPLRPLLPAPRESGLRRDYLGHGWYPVEEDAHSAWVWSEKKAILVFPPGHHGFELLISRPGFTDAPATVVFHSQAGAQLARVSLDAAMHTVQIPPPAETVTIAIQAAPGGYPAGDSRDLGLCLHEINPVEEYREHSAWLPRTMDIETTTICNISPPCVMCLRNYFTGEQETAMPDTVLRAVTPGVRHASFINVQGAGEPLLARQTFAVLQAAQRSNTHASFTTNGLLLNETVAREVLALQLKRINFSLDAATPETYAAIRRQDFAMVTGNIRRLAQLKKEQRTCFPHLCLNMVLMKINVPEAAALVELAAEFQASEVLLQLLNPRAIGSAPLAGQAAWFNYGEQCIDLHEPQVRSHLRAAGQACRRHGIILLASHQEILDIARG